VGAFTDSLNDYAPLRERLAYSRELLERVQAAMTCCDAGRRLEFCIFAAGSLGRFETGRISDLDLFFLAEREGRGPNERSLTRLAEIQSFADVIKVNRDLELPAFSGDGQYLKVHEVADIISATGDSNDDSENRFTTRLLLLLESQPICNEGLYNTAITRVLEMYFRDGRGKKNFRPLFLLNDILRYWRTLCLNYERSRAEPGKPWWKRNLNLKFSRKLTVFSSVLAIIACKVSQPEAFRPISELVPLQRLALALDTMDDGSLLSEFSEILVLYEDFLAAKSHAELEGKEAELLARFSVKAQRFDEFLHCTLRSEHLDQSLVRFVSI